MKATEQLPLTATEIGTLWMAYQEKTLHARLLEHVLDCDLGQEERQIVQSHYNRIQAHVQTIKYTFEEDGAVIPQGFNEGDVRLGVPRLFDPLFDFLWLRLLSKVQIGLYALHSSMSYRQDIKDMNIQFTAEAQKLYDQTSTYLMQKNILARPPYVTMPEQVEFVDSHDYLKGVRIFSQSRPLNTIEIAHLHQAIETNAVGAQMMIGFAQAASHPEARKFFMKGSQLANKIVSTLSNVFMEDGIQPTATWAGKATNSTVPPFSDKLMMYMTNLLTNFGLGSSAIGGAFSLRGDLPLIMADLSKDTLTYAKEGGKLMIEHGWMEEPPQSEDRNKLVQQKY